MIRSDQKSLMRAVVEKLAKERSEAQTVVEYSPVRSSGSNGVVERAINEEDHQVRTIKTGPDQNVNTDSGVASSILT